MNKTKKKIKILFVYYSFSSFVRKDLEILQKHFDVKKIKFRGIKDVPKIVYYVLSSDLIFAWFAGWHSAFAVFFSKLFRKKSIVVVGGYDAAYVPEINYGAFTNLKERLPAKYVLKNADFVLAVSEYIKREILDKSRPKNVKVIHNGVETERFKLTKEKKEKIVVTIGKATRKHYKLKGLEIFAKASVHFPDYKFIIIGATDNFTVNELKKINPKLVFTGQISHEEVLKWLQCAKVYCQLSFIESFGLGNAEAMSCGCIPVVTNIEALSEIVNNVGFYTPYSDEKETTKAIKNALDAPYELGKKARERILKTFSLKKREKNLIKLIRYLGL